MVDLTYSPLKKTATFGGGNALIGKGSALMADLALTANRGGLAFTANLTSTVAVRWLQIVVIRR